MDETKIEEENEEETDLALIGFVSVIVCRPEFSAGEVVDSLHPST